MGSVKADEMGVSVGRKERPNGLSVGSRSASDKKVVPCFIQDKIRSRSLIYRPHCRRRASRRPDRRLIVNQESVADNWN